MKCNKLEKKFIVPDPKPDFYPVFPEVSSGQISSGSAMLLKTNYFFIAKTESWLHMTEQEGEKEF
jgi:hypothetical protein